MINPNHAIEQKINQFILETQNKFWFEPKQTETRSVSRLFMFVS